MLCLSDLVHKQFMFLQMLIPFWKYTEKNRVKNISGLQAHSVGVAVPLFIAVRIVFTAINICFNSDIVETQLNDKQVGSVQKETYKNQ